MSYPPSSALASNSSPSKRVKRIVLTGGPGGGKSTAGDLLRREFGARCAFVPEAATLLFTGGYPRYSEIGALEALQQVIYHTQLGLEKAQACHFPNRVLLCDRGTVDGAAYWQKGTEDFFVHVGSTLEAELARYDGIIFMESASVTNLPINATMLEGGNLHRTEASNEARNLDHKLRDLYSRHPNFVLIPSSASFVEKILSAVKSFSELLEKVENGDGPHVHLQ